MPSLKVFLAFCFFLMAAMPAPIALGQNMLVSQSVFEASQCRNSSCAALSRQVPASSFVQTAKMTDQSRLHRRELDNSLPIIHDAEQTGESNSGLENVKPHKIQPREISKVKEEKPWPTHKGWPPKQIDDLSDNSFLLDKWGGEHEGIPKSSLPKKEKVFSKGDNGTTGADKAFAYKEPSFPKGWFGSTGDDMNNVKNDPVMLDKNRYWKVGRPFPMRYELIKEADAGNSRTKKPLPPNTVKYESPVRNALDDRVFSRSEPLLDVTFDRENDTITMKFPPLNETTIRRLNLTSILNATDAVDKLNLTWESTKKAVEAEFNLTAKVMEWAQGQENVLAPRSIEPLNETLAREARRYGDPKKQVYTYSVMDDGSGLRRPIAVDGKYVRTKYPKVEKHAMTTLPSTPRGVIKNHSRHRKHKKGPNSHFERHYPNGTIVQLDRAATLKELYYPPELPYGQEDIRTRHVEMDDAANGTASELHGHAHRNGTFRSDRRVHYSSTSLKVGNLTLYQDTHTHSKHRKVWEDPEESNDE